MARGTLGPGLGALREFLKRRADPLSGVLVALLLAIAFGPTLVGHVRGSMDPFRFADDVRILVPPLYRAVDSELFPRDPVNDYFLAGLPDALYLVYSSLAPLVDPEVTSKVLPYLLLAFAVGCLVIVARLLGGNVAVLGAVALALGSGHVMARIAGGLPRAFALPLLLAGALCLVRGRPIALAAVAVIATAFYPVAGVVLGFCLLGLFLLPAKDRGDASGYSVRRRAVVLALTVVGMALVVLPSAMRLRAWGPVIDAELARNYPEAGQDGRFDAIDRPPFPSLPEAFVGPATATLVGDGAPLLESTNQRARGTVVALVLCVLAAGGFVVLTRRRVGARRLLVLPVAVVVAHTLALIATPHLFLPERYMAYGIPAALLCVVPAAFSFLDDHRHVMVRRIPLAWNVVVLLLVGARGASWAGMSVLIPPPERPLYETIAKLPKSAVVAGWPGFAIDNVPYLSRRTAFLTRETHMPFHVRYTEFTHERMRALVWAYFASEPERLRSLQQTHGVTHLVVDRRHFVYPPPYFKPFDADTHAAFEAGKAKGFELLRVVERGEGIDTGGLSLVDLSRI